ncbi:MAG: DUF3501 family protein [Burkholderiales bacterium]|nr:DUF3501 family protein [Ferrovum sp.]
MPAITRESLMTLEAYARERKQFRTGVIAHKRLRTLHLGDHVTLLFEDELTMRYQVQEMLRIERIFEEAGIQEELNTYNPLIPDGSNWKATLLIEYEDLIERARMLGRLMNVEGRIWMQVAGHARVFPIADEDLERQNDTKTSTVHFLRYELTPEMIAALRAGAVLSAGVDHPAYHTELAAVPAALRESLLADLTGF